MLVTQPRNCITYQSGILACELSWRNQVVKIQDEDLVLEDVEEVTAAEAAAEETVVAAVVVETDEISLGLDLVEIIEDEITAHAQGQRNVADPEVQNGALGMNVVPGINDPSQADERADLTANPDRAVVAVLARRWSLRARISSSSHLA